MTESDQSSEEQSMGSGSSEYANLETDPQRAQAMAEAGRELERRAIAQPNSELVRSEADRIESEGGEAYDRVRAAAKQEAGKVAASIKRGDLLAPGVERRQFPAGDEGVMFGGAVDALVQPTDRNLPGIDPEALFAQELYIALDLDNPRKGVHAGTRNPNNPDAPIQETRTVATPYGYINEVHDITDTTDRIAYMYVSPLNKN